MGAARQLVTVRSAPFAETSNTHVSGWEILGVGLGEYVQLCACAACANRAAAAVMMRIVSFMFFMFFMLCLVFITG